MINGLYRVSYQITIRILSGLAMRNYVISVPYRVSDCKSFFSVFPRALVGLLDMFDILTYLNETQKVDIISIVSEVHVENDGC